MKIELAAATFRGIHDETVNEGEEGSDATYGDAHGGGGGGGRRKRRTEGSIGKEKAYGLPRIFSLRSSAILLATTLWEDKSTSRALLTEWRGNTEVSRAVPAFSFGTLTRL